MKLPIYFCTFIMLCNIVNGLRYIEGPIRYVDLEYFPLINLLGHNSSEAMTPWPNALFYEIYTSYRPYGEIILHTEDPINCVDVFNPSVTTCSLACVKTGEESLGLDIYDQVIKYCYGTNTKDNIRTYTCYKGSFLGLPFDTDLVPLVCEFEHGSVSMAFTEEMLKVLTFTAGHIFDAKFYKDGVRLYFNKHKKFSKFVRNLWDKSMTPLVPSKIFTDYVAAIRIGESFNVNVSALRFCCGCDEFGVFTYEKFYCEEYITYNATHMLCANAFMRPTQCPFVNIPVARDKNLAYHITHVPIRGGDISWYQRLLMEMLSPIISVFSSVVETFAGGFERLIENVVPIIVQIFESLLPFFEKIIKLIVDGIVTLVKALVNAIFVCFVADTIEAVLTAFLNVDQRFHLVEACLIWIYLDNYKWYTKLIVVILFWSFVFERQYPSLVSMLRS